MKTACRTILFSGAGLCLALVSACATKPPTLELRDARAAYRVASVGAASETVPWRVDEAKRALRAAELARKDEPGSQREADLAYIAHRKALRATADARQEDTRERIAFAKAREQETVMVSELRTTRETERLAKAFAQRGKQLISIPGHLLFRTDDSQLLPNAKQQLDQVAGALRQQQDAQVTIEGHADSRGTDAHNQALSERRATSVRDYLVGQGVPSDKMSVVGRGEADPIADNQSAEGRAVNRRVDIEVHLEGGGGETPTPTTPPESQPKGKGPATK
jgi:outer membrane protein OmpA-like peptidoglycan-associated protein